MSTPAEHERTIRQIAACMIRQDPAISLGPSTHQGEEAATSGPTLAPVQGEGVIEGHQGWVQGEAVVNDHGERVGGMLPVEPDYGCC